MLENGAHLRVIRTLLGHAAIVTMEIHTRPGIRKVETVHSNTHPSP
jgi:site-specific recombinase XerD